VAGAAEASVRARPDARRLVARRLRARSRDGRSHPRTLAAGVSTAGGHAATGHAGTHRGRPIGLIRERRDREAAYFARPADEARAEHTPDEEARYRRLAGRFLGGFLETS
jgi:hypothetical protein